MKKKYVLILILLLSVGGILLGRSLGRGGKVWRERARVLEAEKATADGLLVAARVNQAELLGKVETLGEQIDDLEVKLGEKPKIKTVIQTRTNPINVDAKLLLVEADAKIRALNEQIRADNEGRDDPCPECPDIETLLGAPRRTTSSSRSGTSLPNWSRKQAIRSWLVRENCF
ncbi:MAG: hypothetical protein E4H01_10955 [Lysobacterales bacterium]|nr:MAG: hypothetical protein E4H01_10955 [Xanthomonadales bacterium]